MASSYFEVLTAAVNDMIANGFDSAERVKRWQAALDQAASASLKSEAELDAMLRQALGSVYRRQVEQGAVLANHRGIARWTYEKIKPRLRSELDRRLMASMDLIRLNRTQMMARQAQRFSGWATSIPAGGAAEADRSRLKVQIRKPLASLPFEERRVMIDQSAKLVSAINDVVAKDGGAVAAKWRHVHQSGYNARPDHLARDGKVFLIRGSWADEGGLVKPGEAGYTDDVEQPAEFPYCRCAYVYVYALRSLPADMLTKKGQAALDEARQLTAA